MSEASRQAEPKEPMFAEPSIGSHRNFRVAIRFFDYPDAEQLSQSSREAAQCESPARQCRVSGERGASPEGTAEIAYRSLPENTYSHQDQFLQGRDPSTSSGDSLCSSPDAAQDDRPSHAPKVLAHTATE